MANDWTQVGSTYYDSPRPRRWPWILAGVAVLAIAAGGAWWYFLPKTGQPGWRNPAATPPSVVQQEIAGIKAGTWHPAFVPTAQDFLDQPYTPKAVVEALYAKYGPTVPGGNPQTPNFPRWVSRLRMTQNAANWLANQSLNPVLTAQIFVLTIEDGSYEYLPQALATGTALQNVRTDNAQDTPAYIRKMDQSYFKHTSWNPVNWFGVAPVDPNSTIVTINDGTRVVWPTRIAGNAFSHEDQFFETKVNGQWRVWQTIPGKSICLSSNGCPS